MGENTSTQRDGQVDLFFMLVNAGFLAFFGWNSNWAHRYTTDVPPQLIMMIAILMWSMRIGAIAFGLAFVLSLLKSEFGRLLNLITGLGVSVVFAMVAIWDFTSPFFSGVPPLLLMILAVWNGYLSVVELRERFAARPVNSPPVV